MVACSACFLPIEAVQRGWEFMQAQDAVGRLREKGFFLSPDALKLVSESAELDKLVQAAIENAGDRLFLDASDFQPKEKTKVVSVQQGIVKRTEFKPLAADLEARVRVLGGDPGFSRGGIEDFVSYFRDRYDQMAGFFAERAGSVTGISDLQKYKGERVKIVALVSEKKTTKNGHLLLQLEDTSGFATALVPASNKRTLEQAASIIRDEVVAFEGKLSKDLFIIEDFCFPDLPTTRPQPVIENDFAVAFLSDMHIGSHLFLRKNFEQFISWLRGEWGNEKEQELAGKVKYVVIAGDAVDGIGIYPNQETELDITDIYEQYAVFSQYLKRFPEYVQIIVCPGNHDAVKHADPQPALPKELVPDLYEMKNVHLASSPSLLDLDGLKTLVYHGTSFDDLIPAVPGLNYDETQKVMVETLKRRHLHPIYGGRPITPSGRDSLVISEVPDVFHCGHLHKNGYEKYRGVTCVNSGTWQQVTQYQVQQGHKPTPCILPVYEAKTGSLRVVRFDGA